MTALSSSWCGYLNGGGRLRELTIRPFFSGLFSRASRGSGVALGQRNALELAHQLRVGLREDTRIGHGLVHLYEQGVLLFYEGVLRSLELGLGCCDRRSGTLDVFNGGLEYRGVNAREDHTLERAAEELDDGEHGLDRRNGCK